MPVDIVVPSVGESISEGTLSRWLKKDGDSVRVQEPLFELETEKATTEVTAQTTGTVRIAVAEGQTVRIGAVVGHIEEGAVAALEKQPAVAPPPPSPPVPVKATVKEEVSLSPAARRLAEEKQVIVAGLVGSGRDGRVIKEDVQAVVDREKTPAPAPAPDPVPVAPVVKPLTAHGAETRQKMSSIRQRIAGRLLESQQTTATLTTFNEADMTAVSELRTRYKDRFKEKHGVGLGFMSFFVKAVVEGLKAYPIVHARIDGGDIVTPGAYHIGVAVSTERGLMVPVVRDVDELSFAQVEKGIAALAVKARDGKIGVTDLQGGSFTITNGGVFGSMLSTPILNPPQSAILGLHAIQKRPIAINDQAVVRPMMYLALSYDHRVIDGREAVLFLVRVKECIESPERMLLEI